MRLHEYYFGNMSKEVAAPNTKSALHKKIVAAFGSFEHERKNCKYVSIDVLYY
jgi:superoxide dismutase